MVSREINEIEKYFLCCTSLKSFGLEDDVADAWYYSLEGQKLLLEHTILHPLAKQWPINHSYVQHFLKTVITQLERQGYEVLDEIYVTYCESLRSPQLGTHYKHYVLNEDKVKAISLVESNSIISCGTTGLCTWQASLMLAEWGLQKREFLKNKRVLELGSGVGLAGLSVALCCEPQCFCFTDVHPEVLQTLKSNILINVKSGTIHKSQIASVMGEELSIDSDIVLHSYANNTEIHVLNLPWKDVDKSNALQKLQPFDVILAADVVYDSSLFEDLCKALCHFVSKDECVAFLACTIRNQDTVDAFTELLRANALIIEEQTVPNANHFIYSEELPLMLYKISKSK